MHGLLKDECIVMHYISYIYFIGFKILLSKSLNIYF